MKPPRLSAGAVDAPPFAGDVPETLDELAPYAEAYENTPALPALRTTPSLPRLRPRVELVQALTVAILAASGVMLALSLALALTKSSSTVVAQRPDPSLAATGRGGADRVDCMDDVIVVAVTRAVATDSGVLVARAEAPNGTVLIVLRAVIDRFRGELRVHEGRLFGDATVSGLAIWPGERILLRADGVVEARELYVGGQRIGRGSRGDGPCA